MSILHPLINFVACSSPRISTFVVCVCTCVCQGVTPFGSSQSRCLIFRLACVYTCVCCFVKVSHVPVHVFVLLSCVYVHVYAKVSHLSAALSQDASSFGWHVSINGVSCFVKVSHVPVLIRLLCLMFHLACGMCKFVYMFMLHYFTQLAYV